MHRMAVSFRRNYPIAASSGLPEGAVSTLTVLGLGCYSSQLGKSKNGSLHASLVSFATEP